MKKFILVLAVLILYSYQIFPYDFNEHRDIGNRAFNEAFKMVLKQGYFKDSTDLATFLKKNLDMGFYAEDSAWYFDELSNYPNYISYGIICGLSGDHEQNPLSLKDKLIYTESVLNKILALQNKAWNEFSTGASDDELLSTDFRYGIFAALDMSHFYDYGLPLTDHINEFEKSRAELLKRPSNVTRIFKELMKVNSIVKYMTIHSFAIHLGQLSGSTLKNGDSAKAYVYLFYALIFNAFADHFLEDMFAAGHLVVNRSLLGGLINNKALHDFYNILGLRVMNLKGETWITHGDRTLNIPDEKWSRDKDYGDIKKIYITEKFQRVINAGAQSIFEIWTAFYKASQDGKVDFINSIPSDDTDKNKKERFFLDKFKIFYMIPVPFGSNIFKYDFKSKNLPRLIRINNLLAQRNFVRSRIANSLIFTIGTFDNKFGFERVPDNAYLYLGGRFNLSSKLVIYDDSKNKTGSMDHWFGLTFSLLAGLRREDKGTIWQYKGGLVYTGDFWVSRTRYVSPFMYLEAGIDRRDKEWNLLLAPSVGLQLGPLIGLDNFSLPQWLRIPLALILPLKPVLSYEVIANKKPELKLLLEIDLLF